MVTLNEAMTPQTSVELHYWFNEIPQAEDDYFDDMVNIAQSICEKEGIDLEDCTAEELCKLIHLDINIHSNSGDHIICFTYTMPNDSDIEELMKQFPLTKCMIYETHPWLNQLLDYWNY